MGRTGVCRYCRSHTDIQGKENSRTLIYQIMGDLKPYIQ